MGIKFTCPHCKNALNVKSNLAGKRGRCPKCDAKIDIPAEGGVADAAIAPSAGAAPVARTAASATSPQTAAVKLGAAALAAVAPASGAKTTVSLLHEEATSAVVPAAAAMAVAGAVGQIAPPDPIDESPDMQWYVMPAGASSQYGPAAGDAFRSWIKEGRVTADSLVWRQDWPEWKRAGSVFPELDAAAGAAPYAPAVASGFAIPTAVGALPTATGVLPMAGTVPVPGFGFPTAVGAPGDLPVAVAGILVIPPTSAASTVRRTQYRPRSNTGPVAAIVVLVILMIPLSYFVIKVISDQWSQPPAAPAAGKESPDQ